MKAFCAIFGFFIMTCVIYFAHINNSTLTLVVPYTKIAFEAQFFMVASIVFIIGMLTDSLFSLPRILENDKKAADTRKRLEKVSVGADDSELRVKTLENKIQTLELALKKALDEKD